MKKRFSAKPTLLRKRLLTAGDAHGFDVAGESGKLEVLFEEPEEVKFVILPNAPVREIWVSALSTSFKLGWSEAKTRLRSRKERPRLVRAPEPPRVGGRLASR